MKDLNVRERTTSDLIFLLCVREAHVGLFGDVRFSNRALLDLLFDEAELGPTSAGGLPSSELEAALEKAVQAIADEIDRRIPIRPEWQP